MASIEIKPLTPSDYHALSLWTGQRLEDIQRNAKDHHQESRDHWLAWDGPAVIGGLSPWHSPDGRLRLYFDKCRDDAWGPLLEQVAGPAITTIDGDDHATFQALTALGFSVSRTDLIYNVPVRPYPALPLPGFEILSAADLPVEEVMALDCLLRDDVPGTDGWTEALQWFREENHDSPYFDPACYLIAQTEGQNVGLIRVWNGPRPLPRLGMVGVLPPYRQRGLAGALVAQVMTVWAQRGAISMTGEIDQSNAASLALAVRFGGQVTGSELELKR